MKQLIVMAIFSGVLCAAIGGFLIVTDRAAGETENWPTVVAALVTWLGSVWFFRAMLMNDKQ